MIERYSRPEMRAIWTEENKFKAWLEVEICACEAWAELESSRTKTQLNCVKTLNSTSHALMK